jgi:hypothetical protein
MTVPDVFLMLYMCLADVCFVAALSYGLAYSAVEGPQAKVWLTSELSNTNHTHFNPQVHHTPHSLP